MAYEGATTDTKKEEEDVKLAINELFKRHPSEYDGTILEDMGNSFFAGFLEAIDTNDKLQLLSGQEVLEHAASRRVIYMELISSQSRGGG